MYEDFKPFTNLPYSVSWDGQKVNLIVSKALRSILKCHNTYKSTVHESAITINIAIFSQHI